MISTSAPQFIDMAFDARKKYNNFLDMTVNFTEQNKIRDIKSPGLFMLCRMCLANDNLCPADMYDHAYLGTNCSYNLAKLEKNDYVIRFNIDHDKRRVFLKPTLKAKKLVERYMDFIEENAEEVNSIFKPEKDK